jgi:hypothetical protein
MAIIMVQELSWKVESSLVRAATVEERNANLDWLLRGLRERG